MATLMGSRYSEYFKSAITLNGVYNYAATMWFTDIPEWVAAETLGKGHVYHYSN